MTDYEPELIWRVCYEGGRHGEGPHVRDRYFTLAGAKSAARHTRKMNDRYGEDDKGRTMYGRVWVEQAYISPWQVIDE